MKLTLRIKMKVAWDMSDELPPQKIKASWDV